MAQTGTDWVPTKDQLRLLDTARENWSSLESLCRLAEVPRRTFYNWLANDAHFLAAWHAMWRHGIEGDMPAIVEAQKKKAMDGDTPAATFVGKLAGYFVDKSESNVNVSGGVIFLPQEKPE